MAPGDPWSVWANSGASREICLELKSRGLLAGATSPDQKSTRHLHGPKWSYGLERWCSKLVKKLFHIGEEEYLWRSEREGIVGRILQTAEPQTPVVYVFHTPEVDLRFPINRIRYSILDFMINIF